jgi:hypothetical protein
MATTTNYSWSTPDDTALVKDGAAAIRTLGSSVDTTTKALNPSTTLGDIEYRSSTANTNTRLGIGTTGQVLSVSGGVPAWATPAPSSPASATASVVTQQNTTSTSFTDLTTAGPAVTLTTGTKVLVIVTCWLTNGTSQGDAESDFAVSGATTRAANEETSLYFKGDAANTSCGLRASSATYLTVTAGSNTFTVKYRRQAGVGTATFKNRQITVIDLGS